MIFCCKISLQRATLIEKRLLTMSIIAYQTIKQLREAKSMSQEHVAQHIRLSRPSYAAVEMGLRDLTLTQLYSLAELLEVKATSLLSSPNYRIDKIDYYDYEKFKQLILACLKFGGDSRDGKITKTKLAKLVYLSDFVCFYRCKQPISGVTYKHIHQGPVADEYFRAIDDLFNVGLIAIKPSGTALMISPNEEGEIDMLRDKEISLIKEICLKWRDKSTTSIVEFTHQQCPWRDSEAGDLIAYETILSEDIQNLY
jgi:transcriptional regulator with XRE-family HTH domain